MTKPIKFGVYEGFPTRFTSDGGIEIWCSSDDGVWFEPSRPLETYMFGTAVSEAEFHRLFDKYDPLPLPMHAFCRDGWRLPLV